ncbi:HET-domain-containing protein [Acephala macrosclerotiorum]|nr:HET-domain-containing protein [Acephala macrosclerotiorum]
MICQTCQNIFRGSCSHKRSVFDANNHHSYLYQLEQAAFEECHICRVLWEAISDHPPTNTKEALEAPDVQDTVIVKPISQYYIRHRSLRSRENIHNISILSLVVDKNGVPNGINGLIGASFNFCLQPMRKAGSHLGTEEPSDPSWTSSMILARKWLHRCLESHNRCLSAQTSGLTNFIPTRLLQIGEPSADKIRLLLYPDRAGIEIQYTTLSHCWGTSHVLKLTSTSLQRLQGGIAISDLGQTFQDAIFTARSLGIQFIWIDSLCIFQDSREDWQREAPLMSNYYRSAMLNIAASVAADNKAGCFPDRNQSLIKPCTIETAWVDCQNENYYLYRYDFWRHAFKDMPLMKRAWVVQELILAPRILHLSGTQLFWECYDLDACETYPDGVPPDMEISWVTRGALWDAFSNVQHRLVAIERVLETPSKDDLWKLWAGIVETYTACNLTYASDKLVALSGVAKLMELALDDQYCAGLWRKKLATQLAWVSGSYGQQPDSRHEPYRAPSWSWASLDGPISSHFYSEESYIKIETLINIIDCEIKSATDDTTSVITGGTLRLSGWLASLELRHISRNEWSVFFDGTWWGRHPNLHINLDCQPPTLRLHCLPLFVNTEQAEWNASCLLLSPTRVSKGQFRRFGILSIFAGTFGMKDCTGFRDTKNEPWLEYEALGSNGQYMISIV